MNNLEQKIQEYFNQENVKNNLNDLIQKYFVNPKQRVGFLKVFELVKKGEFDCDDLYDFMNEWLGIDDIESALKIDQELFDQVYGDVYDELQELYDENSKKQISGIEEIKNESSPESQTGLVQKYNSFIMSSLFQNILVSQEMMNEKFVSTQTMQNEFYTAINAGDKIRAVAVLRILCAKGKLGSSFQNDKRYLDFWAGFLERHYGVDVKEKFLQNPVDKKYFVEFLRFILEKRLNFSVEESSMIGAGLAALCAESGEKEFAEMAYGDEEKGKFVWSE